MSGRGRDWRFCRRLGRKGSEEEVEVVAGSRLDIRACCELHESELERFPKEVGHVELVHDFSMKL